MDSEYIVSVSDALHPISLYKAWVGSREIVALTYTDEPCKDPCMSTMRNLVFVDIGLKNWVHS